MAKLWDCHGIRTPTEVAKRLKVKPLWAFEQNRERAAVRNSVRLTHIKRGRYLRFDWKDVVGHSLEMLIEMTAGNAGEENGTGS